MKKETYTEEIKVVRGNRLRECRRERGMTQSQLAEAVDCLPENRRTQNRSSQHIGRIERGISILTRDYAHLLAQALEVREEYLLCEDDYKSSSDFQKAKLKEEAEREDIDFEAEVNEIYNQFNYRSNSFMVAVKILEACGYKFDSRHRLENPTEFSLRGGQLPPEQDSCSNMDNFDLEIKKKHHEDLKEIYRERSLYWRDYWEAFLNIGGGRCIADNENKILASLSPEETGVFVMQLYETVQAIIDFWIQKRKER